MPWINRWAASWFAARVEGCRAATVEGTVSAEVAAETRACLAESREELAGLLEVLVEDPKVAVLEAWPFEPGAFVVVFWTKGETTGSMTTIVAGDPQPVPPPAPPGPPPPAPANPLRDRLKAAYATDDGADTDKADTRTALALLYRQAVPFAADKTIPTTDALMERMRKAAEGLATDQYSRAELKATRNAIAAVLAAQLPPGQVLTDAQRKAAAELFLQVADALTW